MAVLKKTKVGVRENKGTKFILMVVTRAVTLYLLLFLVIHFSVDYDKIILGLKVRTLNHLLPASFESLLEVGNSPQSVSSRNELNHYRDFFEKVVTYMPERWDAPALLAYCLYYSGDIAHSQTLYEKSIGINKNFFWSYYNLGLIYFQKGDCRKAAEALTQGLSLRVENTLSYIQYSATLYNRILVTSPQLNQVTVQNHLNMGYYQAYYLLGLSYQSLNETEKLAPILKKIQDIQSHFGFPDPAKIPYRVYIF